MENRSNNSNTMDMKELSEALNKSELSGSKHDDEKPLYNKDIKNISAFLKKAELFRCEHNWEEAFKKYNEVISLDPNFLNIFYERGFTYLLAACINKYNNSFKDNEIVNNLKIAVEDINKQIKSSGDHYVYYFILGLAYKQLGNLESAKINFDKAKGLNKEIDIKKCILRFDKR